jgi:pimeloyl-ACP methyl ester carboxylesterase
MTAALILLHGYPFDSTMWEAVRQEFPAGPHVFAPDLRCAGGDVAVEPSLEQLADDVADLARAHGVARVFLAGMSMGGYVALAFAERHAELLAGLALISTHASPDSDEQSRNRRLLIDRIRADGLHPAVDAILPKLFAARPGADAARRIRESAYRYGVDGLCWALEAMARRPDRHRILAGIRVPLLIIRGSEDAIVSRAHVESMMNANPDALFVELAGAGHTTPLEAPVPLASALVTWLRD